MPGLFFVRPMPRFARFGLFVVVFYTFFVISFPVKFALLSPGRARQRQSRAYGPDDIGGIGLF
jgi:hypothetical protein